MDDLLRKRGCRPFFARKIVRYAQYLPHFRAKTGSAPRPLATATILGQPPRKEPRRPKQASLRRAVSTAYYALFHLLVEASSKTLVSGQGNVPLQRLVGRAYQHAEMKKAAEAFRDRRFPAGFDAVLDLPEELRNVAAMFVDLQQERHRADYNLAVDFSKTEVTGLVRRARTAFDAWESARRDPASKYFLVALAFHSRWRR